MDTQQLAQRPGPSPPADGQPRVASDLGDGLISQQLMRDSHSSWYLAGLRNSPVPVSSSFDQAVALLKKELALDDAQAIWLESQNSLGQVQETVQSALRLYESRRKASKAREWLTSCSSRILYYGSIFDVYAQHHPEYVSLAWGTMKFLFIAVLNHEELLAEISKAVSQIADVLPRNELHSCLYPTPRMKEAVCQVNAKILEFFIKAVQWARQGKLKHSFSSIAKPFKISYKPVIAEIAEGSRRVDELANAALKAEMRDHHMLSMRMMEMLTAQQQTQTLHSQSLFTLQQQHKVLFNKGQIEDIRNTFLLTDAPASEESLAYCRSTRNRRRQKMPTQLPRASLATLKSWVSDTESSLLLAEGLGMRTSSLDFAADFLDAVRERGYHIIWSLPFPDGDERPLLTMHCILRSLISQCLALNSDIVSHGVNPLSTKHFQAAQDVEQWLQLFERCVITIPRLFLIVDLGMIETAINNGQSEDDPFSVNQFLEYLQDLVERHTQYLKIVVLAWKFTTATSLEAGSIFNENRIHTDLGRRVERMMRQPKYRAMYKRRNQKMAEEFRASVIME